MAQEALALKYRPKVFDDLTEQNAIKEILLNQLETNTVKHGYLFVGPAGCGKTTSARIFANMINNGEGSPIELDAASNNGVDEIRKLIDNAQTKSLDSEYKIFVIDECHMITNQGWNAFLKTLEEPPAKSIFILCTTNPEKIPATILSRVQRYNFQKMSGAGIVKRLDYICNMEHKEGRPITWDTDSLSLLAKMADGGMRDGITLLDKCLSYSDVVSVDNIIKALGVADYETMFELTDALANRNIEKVIEIVDRTYSSGIDLKQFIKTYFEFILDCSVYHTTNNAEYIKIPNNYHKGIYHYTVDFYNRLLTLLVQLQNSIKYDGNPKSVILAQFILFMGE